MPELPEVESTVRFLQERIIGCAFEGARIFWKRSVHARSAQEFSRRITDARIAAVTRRGKYIVLHLDGRDGKRLFLLCHLRMSGSLDVVRKDERVGTHDRVILGLDNGKELRFNDVRKFGRLYLVDAMEQITGALGVEPFDDAFTPQFLHQQLRARRGAIKPLLLNQRVIAGIGNIYADEVLWRCGLHPLLRSNRLTLESAKTLHQNVRAVLKEAIEAQGTDFGDGVVEMGSFVPAAYGRSGQPCVRCKTIIVRIVVGQRGTHFCPHCQARSKRRWKKN